MAMECKGSWWKNKLTSKEGRKTNLVLDQLQPSPTKRVSTCGVSRVCVSVACHVMPCHGCVTAWTRAAFDDAKCQHTTFCRPCRPKLRRSHFVLMLVSCIGCILDLFTPCMSRRLSLIGKVFVCLRPTCQHKGSRSTCIAPSKPVIIGVQLAELGACVSLRKKKLRSPSPRVLLLLLLHGPGRRLSSSSFWK